MQHRPRRQHTTWETLFDNCDDSTGALKIGEQCSLKETAFAYEDDETLDEMISSDAGGIIETNYNKGISCDARCERIAPICNE